MTDRIGHTAAPQRTSNFRALVIRGCASAVRPVEVVLPPHAVTACVDALQIERMVDNLVSNACKHTPSECTITVTLTDVDGIVINVDDDSPEIASSARESIFEPFRRLSSDAHGNGIGLYLVRQLAGFHGETATCGTRPGGGNRFTVTIGTESVVPTPTG